MAEYWDLYDYKKNKINKVVKRGDKLKNDEFHLVSNAWIKNSKGEFLITQRVATKPHPLMWECTGGSALKGEDFLVAAIKEVKEELGVNVYKKDAKFIGRSIRYYQDCPDILEVWIFYCDIDIKKVKIQEEEVNDVRWATKDEILNLYFDHKFEATSFFGEAINS